MLRNTFNILQLKKIYLPLTEIESITVICVFEMQKQFFISCLMDEIPYLVLYTLNALITW